MYNLTFMENATSIVSIVQGVNTEIAEGLFFTILLFVLAIIAIITLWNTDFKVMAISICFGLAVLSTLFWALGLVAFYIVGLICVLLFASIFIKMIWR